VPVWPDCAGSTITGARAHFLLAALGISLLIQIGAILAADPQWEWTGDAHIFRNYLTTLADEGYAPETLESLSQNYDYRVWTRRAQPFYFALQVWAGPHAVRAIQFFQAILITLSLALTWRLAQLLFGQRIAFWATSLQLLMPFRWFICLDLNHHILGGFYFLAGLWLLAEWLRPDRRPLQTGILLLCAGALLPLMRLEGGIDVVYIGAVLFVLVGAWVAGRQTARQSLVSVAAQLAWPLLASTLLVSPFVQRIDQADLHHHESGPVAFMARGWAPETGGEYCYTYELIDFLTPPADKKPMQASLLASQAFYNPRALLFPLLPTKFAKYFLLGYASGAEEMLARAGTTGPELAAEGARTAYLLVVLPLMLWGGALLLPRLRRGHCLVLVLPCSLLCATYVLLGETSPRYSFYIQPFLFMLGALPLAWRGHRRRLLHFARRPGLVATASLLAVALLAAAALFAARPGAHRFAVQDMREWSASPESQPLALPATLAPFEIQLAPQRDASGTSWGALLPPALTPAPRHLLFYVIPEGAPSALVRNAPLLVTCGARTQTNSLPGRIRMEYPDPAFGPIYFRSPANLPYPLRIGYATYEFDEKTTD
jgi:hypothetical protein